MKVAIVPAQVTTIEDKVAGGLGLQQLVLLVTPIILFGVMYGILPPNFTLVAYKLILAIVLGVCIGLLAVKVKGLLVLQWVLILSRYLARPQLYLFDKRSLAARQARDVQQPEAVVVSNTELRWHPPVLNVAVHERVALEALINGPDAKLHFKTDKKGRLRVAISKVE